MKEIVLFWCLVLSATSVLVQSCNEGVCASVVSKCLLIQSCNCDTQNHTCSALCYTCLGKLFIECCSCVDLCPKENEAVSDTLSTVEDMEAPIPELFKALVETGDMVDHWTSETFENSYTTSRGDIISQNCSVIWWKQCVNYQKCKEQCISLGASSTRMFHNGCCECIGDACVHYGRSESGCKHCPFDGNSDEYPLEEDEEDDQDLDYGEDSEFD